MKDLYPSKAKVYKKTMVHKFVDHNFVYHVILLVFFMNRKHDNADYKRPFCITTFSVTTFFVVLGSSLHKTIIQVFIFYLHPSPFS